MNAPSVLKHQFRVDKNHPIFEFLKNVPDESIKELTKKLGKNNLRNFNSMRSFLSDYFFNYDKKTPLESLKKFMKGELPELNVTLTLISGGGAPQAPPPLYIGPPFLGG